MSQLLLYKFILQETYFQYLLSFHGKLFLLSIAILEYHRSYYRLNNRRTMVIYVNLLCVKKASLCFPCYRNCYWYIINNKYLKTDSYLHESFIRKKKDCHYLWKKFKQGLNSEPYYMSFFIYLFILKFQIVNIFDLLIMQKVPLLIFYENVNVFTS